jgi:Spy/CpxP family protein refolding chaperone
MMRRSVVVGIAAFFMFAVVSWGFAQPAQPQGEGKPGMQHPMMKMTDEERAKKDEEKVNARVDELTKKLNLTPEQQAKVREILDKTAAQVRVFMKEASEKVKALMEQDKETIKALLTPEQKPKLEQIPQEPGPQPTAPQPPAGGNKQ